MTDSLLPECCASLHQVGHVILVVNVFLLALFLSLVSILTLGILRLYRKANEPLHEKTNNLGYSQLLQS